ncbi:hypothetical protein Leryth_002364 [Lithospermum erythrorhizon]|nr:hypothetical protein Leryth_002364 [Lithospermum erythrorhizon]
MSKRKPKAKETLTTIPRRSPRFLSTNSPEALNPNTPKLKHEPIHILRSSATPLSPTSKSKYSNEDLSKLVSDEVSINTKAGVSLSSNRVELRRSMRLSEIKNQLDGVENGVESEGGRVLRRGGERVDAYSVVSSKTREGRSLRKRGLGINDGSFSENWKRNVSSASEKAKLGIDLCNEVEGMIEKRATRSDSRRSELEHRKSYRNAMFQGDRNCDSSKNLDKEEFTNEKTQGGVKLVPENYTREENVNNVSGGKEQIGKKRNLNQCKGKSKSDCAKGWSEEQEHALQKAYFAANPTPQFWKRVAKMVPGKSAQDCFDKIHSAHLTPPLAQPRSRAKKITPSSLSFSASKLLDSPEPKSKKPRCSHMVQKTVRHLLQKQCNNDQDEGADFFAIFEATADPSNGASQQLTSYCTPEKNKRGSNFRTKCNDTSSADRKSLSRLNMLSGSCLTSPPVLKQIKNKVLHEKYIDQLHRRETRRKAALSKAAKQVASQNNKLGIQDGKVDSLKAARNALYFDASDAITQLQQSQMNAVYNCDFSDDDHLESSDDGED